MLCAVSRRAVRGVWGGDAAASGGEDVVVVVEFIIAVAAGVLPVKEEQAAAPNSTRGGVVGRGGTFSCSPPPCCCCCCLEGEEDGPLKLWAPAGDGMTVTSAFFSGVRDDVVVPLLLCCNFNNLDKTDNLVSNSCTRSSKNLARPSRSSNSCSRSSIDRVLGSILRSCVNDEEDVVAISSVAFVVVVVETSSAMVDCIIRNNQWFLFFGELLASLVDVVLLVLFSTREEESVGGLSMRLTTREGSKGRQERRLFVVCCWCWLSFCFPSCRCHANLTTNNLSLSCFASQTNVDPSPLTSLCAFCRFNSRAISRSSTHDSRYNSNVRDQKFSLPRGIQEKLRNGGFRINYCNGNKRRKSGLELVARVE